MSIANSAFTSDEFKTHVLESYEFNENLIVDPKTNKKLYICQYALKSLVEDTDISLDDRVEALVLYAWFISVEHTTPVETLFEISPQTEKIVNQAISWYVN